MGFWIPFAVVAGAAVLLGMSSGSSTHPQTSKRLPRPRSWGVPFAEGRGLAWPVLPPSLHQHIDIPYQADDAAHTPVDGVNPSNKVNLARAFHAYRKNPNDQKPRYHAGIDLTANPGDLIISMDEGVVQGPAQGYVKLDALVIEHPTAVVVYAEIKADKGLKPGDKVKMGTPLGTAVPSQGTPSSPISTMLHLETWAPGTKIQKFTPWFIGDPAPSNLLDPTIFLLKTARHEVA